MGSAELIDLTNPPEPDRWDVTATDAERARFALGGRDRLAAIMALADRVERETGKRPPLSVTVPALAPPTHEVVDFGPGPRDRTQGYPFAGSEEQCAAWIAAHQSTVNGRDRYQMQETDCFDAPEVARG